MGFYEAAERILKKTKRPMSIKEITRLALKRKILETDSKNPDQTMGARLYMDIIRNGSKSRFIKIEKGIFGLKALKYHQKKWKRIKEVKRKQRNILAYSDLMPADLLDEFANLFERPGIYTLFDNNEKLWYVGQTVNLARRLDHHTRDRHERRWSKFRIFIVPKAKLDAVESILIQTANPPGNRTKGNLRGAKNITSDIRREIREKIKHYNGLL